MFWTFHSYTDRGAQNYRPPSRPWGIRAVCTRCFHHDQATSIGAGQRDIWWRVLLSHVRVSISITGRPHFTLSCIQYVLNSCIRLPMWEIVSGHMTGIENHWHETNLWWVSKSAKTLWVFFYIEVDANHLHEFVCLLVYLFFCKDCGRTFNVIVKKYNIRIFNEIVTQTTQSSSINLHIHLQI